MVDIYAYVVGSKHKRHSSEYTPMSHDCEIKGQNPFISESITDMFGCYPINLCGHVTQIVIEEIPTWSYDNKLKLL